MTLNNQELVYNHPSDYICLVEDSLLKQLCLDMNGEDLEAFNIASSLINNISLFDMDNFDKTEDMINTSISSKNYRNCFNFDFEKNCTSANNANSSSDIFTTTTLAGLETSDLVLSGAGDQILSLQLGNLSSKDLCHSSQNSIDRKTQNSDVNASKTSWTKYWNIIESKNMKSKLKNKSGTSQAPHVLNSLTIFDSIDSSDPKKNKNMANKYDYKDINDEHNNTKPHTLEELETFSNIPSIESDKQDDAVKSLEEIPEENESQSDDSSDNAANDYSSSEDEVTSIPSSIAKIKNDLQKRSQFVPDIISSDSDNMHEDDRFSSGSFTVSLPEVGSGRKSYRKSYRNPTLKRVHFSCDQDSSYGSSNYSTSEEEDRPLKDMKSKSRSILHSTPQNTAKISNKAGISITTRSKTTTTSSGSSTTNSSSGSSGTTDSSSSMPQKESFLKTPEATKQSSSKTISSMTQEDSKKEDKENTLTKNDSADSPTKVSGSGDAEEAKYLPGSESTILETDKIRENPEPYKKITSSGIKILEQPQPDKLEIENAPRTTNMPISKGVRIPAPRPKRSLHLKDSESLEFKRVPRIQNLMFPLIKKEDETNLKNKFPITFAFALLPPVTALDEFLHPFREAYHLRCLKRGGNSNFSASRDRRVHKVETDIKGLIDLDEEHSLFINAYPCFEVTIYANSYKCVVKALSQLELSIPMHMNRALFFQRIPAKNINTLNWPDENNFVVRNYKKNSLTEPRTLDKNPRKNTEDPRKNHIDNLPIIKYTERPNQRFERLQDIVSTKGTKNKNWLMNQMEITLPDEETNDKNINKNQSNFSMKPNEDDSSENEKDENSYGEDDTPIKLNTKVLKLLLTWSSGKLFRTNENGHIVSSRLKKLQNKYNVRFGKVFLTKHFSSEYYCLIKVKIMSHKENNITPVVKRIHEIINQSQDES